MLCPALDRRSWRRHCILLVMLRVCSPFERIGSPPLSSRLPSCVLLLLRRLPPAAVPANAVLFAAAHVTYISTATMGAREGAFRVFIMIERFVGCRMSHVVGPRDSVVRLGGRSVGLLTYLLTYLTNRAQV